MNLRSIARALRMVADALESAPAPRHVVTIEVAPPGTPEPEPFVDEDEGVNRIYARLVLERALRRYSPRRTYHA